ncbi:carboxypeptidase-like regulatory domain-containing protein [Algibacter sp. 2305UL17-15]|uniref:carboxypeptidase-like regulatory domain-containing protein n=1 Tax=Algibacter sp. 2305UL17-15 TaxID=3231268 RepID=UPI003457DE0B
MKSSILAFGILFFIGLNINYAQNKKLTGKVVAFKAYPINNVSVSSKKLKTETITDSLGYFTIECRKKDKLTFKAAGFQNQTIKIEDTDSLKVNLILINSKNAFKEVVRKKHMHQSDLDYCINNLIDENNNFDQLLTVYDVIQYVHPSARVTSVTANSSGGNTFGASGNQIILGGQGPNSILASPYALLVVDGIVTGDISGVVPEQIKSVKVLTGSNAGHWGTRGGNGVVEITLKHK